MAENMAQNPLQAQTQAPQRTQPAGIPQQAQGENNLNPDVVAAQEEFKDVKNGDTYTDADGKGWQWTSIAFNIVPEETKDEEVDSLESDEGEGAKEDEEYEEDYEEGDESGNIERGLDIALSILKEEDSDAESGEPDGEEGNVAQDEADKIVFDAFCDALGIEGIAEDAEFKDPQPLTMKRQGYYVDDVKDIPYYLQKKKKYKQMEDGRFFVESYLGKSQKHAMENAKRSHRRHVAATYDKCRAKNKAKCPYHGAAYMTAQLGEILKAHGLPQCKYGILQEDPRQGTDKRGPLPYRLLFSVPDGTPAEVRQQIAKEFFAKNPNILFDAQEHQFGIGNNTVFHQKGIERDIDDLPLDSPTQADYDARHENPTEQSYMESSKAEGAVSWTNFDEMSLASYFDMLSERPTNIVECADDMLRYAQQFPELMPEGCDLKEVNDAYKTFMKANAKHKGLQAYLLSGETVNKAEALSAAAEKGLSKNASAYYDAAENVYNMTKEVFNSVEDSLQDQCWNLIRSMHGMPSAEQVSGLNSPNTVYFGDKYRCPKEFPIRVGGETEDLLREAMNDYAARWRAASTMFDHIKMGCSQREPLLVAYGLKRLQVNIEALKRSADMLGEMQDSIIEDQSEKWLKKNKISMPKAEKTKETAPAKEETAKADAEQGAVKTTPTAPQQPTEHPPTEASKPGANKNRKPTPKAEAQGETETTAAQKKASKAQKKKEKDYSKDFEKYEAKIRKKAHEGFSFSNLISQGYEIKPVTNNKTGERAYIMAKSGGDNSANVDTSQPFWNLDSIYAAQIGKKGDKAGYQNFLKTLEWKIKETRR